MKAKIENKNEVATTAMTNSNLSLSPNPSHLLQIALEKNVDMAQLKELMDLQERWEKKEAKKSFFAALSKFQTIIPQLSKNRTANITPKNGGNAFKYKYADLGSISQGIKKALHECGLSYRWEFQEQNAKMKVTCFISHLDGHTEVTSMEAGNDTSGAKNDIQQKGSTQTYLQRYTLIGALGLSTADDDNDAKSSATTQQNNIANNAAKNTPEDDEIIDLWKGCLKDVKTKIELQALYLKNKKIVDKDTLIQGLFKAREAELKKNTSTAKVEMP